MHDECCLVCGEQAFMPAVIKPEMCEKHHELMILISRCVRLERPATVENVQRMVRNVNATAVVPMRVGVDEVGELMSDFKGRW